MKVENVTEKEAFEKERYVIRVVGRKDLELGPLLNKTNGGQGGSGTKLKIDLLGQEFGRLIVIEESGRNKQGRITWLLITFPLGYLTIWSKRLLRLVLFTDSPMAWGSGIRRRK